MIREMVRKSVFYGPLSCFKTSVKELPYSVLRVIFSCFRIKENKVVIDNPVSRELRLVTDALIKTKKFDIVWLCPQDTSLPNGVRSVELSSVRYVYELMTAGIWIDNSRKKNWVKKRKSQLYIQTWHGAICIKMIEKDAVSGLTPSYVKKAKNDSKNADYIVAETKMMERIIKSAFWYDGPIIRAEFKDHILINDEKRKEILNKLGIIEDCNIVLYVPTFRRYENLDCYNIDYNRLITDLSEYDNGKKWKVIVRLHPNIAHKADFINYNNDIINGTFYPALNGLIGVSDILITDYSSCLFYGFRANKKVFLYASDFDRYVAEERGAYFDYNNLPSPLAKTYDELINNIRSLDIGLYEADVKKFIDDIGYYDADACTEIVKILFEQIK